MKSNKIKSITITVEQGKSATEYSMDIQMVNENDFPSKLEAIAVLNMGISIVLDGNEIDGKNG